MAAFEMVVPALRVSQMERSASRDQAPVPGGRGAL
jgi:hypothetical protein